MHNKLNYIENKCKHNKGEVMSLTIYLKQQLEGEL